MIENKHLSHKTIIEKDDGKRSENNFLKK